MPKAPGRTERRRKSWDIPPPLKKKTNPKLGTKKTKIGIISSSCRLCVGQQQNDHQNGVWMKEGKKGGKKERNIGGKYRETAGENTHFKRPRSD